MKYYFNHRMFESVHIYFYLDNVYYGTIYAKENAITSVELPDNVQHVRLSFSTLFDSSEEMEKKEIQELHFPFEIERTSVKNDMEKQSWQFAYDIEIDTCEIKEDLIFTPAEFEDISLKGGLYYQGKKVENGNFTRMRLIKRVESFGIEIIRKKSLITWGVVLIAGIVALPINIFLYQFDGMMAYWYKALGGGIVLDILGILSAGIMLPPKWNYSGMYREHEMKKELFQNENGKLTGKEGNV